MDNDWSLIKTYFGDSAGDRMGESVAITTKNIVAFSAYQDDGNGSNSGEVRIVEFIPNIPTTTVFALGDDSSNKIELTDSDVTTLTLTNGGVAYAVSYNGLLSDFTHIAGTISNHTMKLYVNNTLVDSTSVTSYGDNKTFAYNYIGTNISNSILFEGSIAYFKTWKDYTLTTNEVAELYNSRSIIASVTREETSRTELNHYWEFRNSTLNNIDSINNVEASLVNFLESDSNENGINFDGTSKYIDLSSNVIVVGNDASKGNGFAFETYVKSLNIESSVNGVWNQIGSPIYGESAGDNFGVVVSLSYDGSIIAAGATGADDQGSNSGQIRMFKNTNNNWVQMGQNINGIRADK